MVDKRIYCYLFLLTFLESALQIRPSFHGHNNGFVQDDNEVHYILDNIPISMHKDFANALHGPGDTSIDDKNIQDSIPYIKFEPDILDFKDRQLGVPHQETVFLINKDHNRTIHLTSISGSTQHFHSSFFQDKVIPPLGNTTFNVVFLGREEGEVDSHLHIRTSDGTLRYKVRGLSTRSPYRLRPVVGVKLPLNASFMPFIHMHNPHPEPIQVIEVYSSGSEFQLELPSGEAEGPRELWEIPPYQTKPIIRLHFNAFTEKNHTAYVRFKINNSVEVMIVAVEVEVGSGAGLHWGGNSAWINLGIGGSLQPPIHYPIVLKNSAKKPVKVLNVISTPVSKALTIDFEPTIIPGDTDTPVTIGTLIYDWKAGLEMNHLKGKLLIKGVGPGGSTQKLSIPWNAEVLQGGLEVNTTTTHYFSPFKNQPRNFTVVNRFNLPLAITNVSLAEDARSFFSIKNFVPRVLKPGQKANIFVLVTNNRKNSNNNLISSKLESSIFIYSNVSTTKVPLLSYDGKVRKIIPGERESDRGTMNFGTVGSGTEIEAIFALENKNPISIELHGWGVNMPGAVLELMGCQSGPTDLFNKGVKNITVCSHTGSQSIKPGFLAVFKIKVKTPIVEEDTIVGDVFVRTIYERLTVPVYMQVAHGKISIKKFTFTDCFPGSVCMQQLKIHSTFVRSMKITLIEPIHRDMRVKYIPPSEESLPVINKGDNNVGTIVIDPSVACKQHCYLGLSLNSTAGNQWLNTMSLPSHTRDSDLNLLSSRYTKYLNSTGSGGMWDNITMRLDTTEVRGHQFHINIKPYWPSLVLNMNEKHKNKSTFTFSLTQVGNTSFKMIKIHNPSTKPLIIQLIMDWAYPQGTRLYHLLPSKFKSACYDCPSTIDGEFKLLDDGEERKAFERNWDVTVAPDSLPLFLNPGESRTVKLSYTPTQPAPSSGLLFIRNNLTILQVVRLSGRGAHAQFKFGNRKSGSNTPLLFELAEKHLKDCERERSRKNPIPNLTVKRSFTARNTGELPIDVYGFYINDLHCEGYGFKVLNCGSFKLNPNATKKIEIAFTPDFTLSRIERKLLILTSLGTNSADSDIQQNGMVQLSLLTTLPPHTLETCASVLMRPSWERPVQWAAISFSCIFLMCILAASFLEADKIFRAALLAMSKTSGVQPPLDLRHLATQQTVASSREKLVDEKTNCKKRDEPDWNLMNVKRSKEKETKGFIKIPDWSAEEERKFKMDMESKEIMKSDEVLDTDNSTLVCRKKKRQVDLNDNTEVDQEKKVSLSSKSSPKVNFKVKRDEHEHILLNNEVREKKKIQHNISSNFINNSTNNNNSNNNNNNSNSNNIINSNNSSYKKYEANASQKVAHYSEEDTSSTTTESSTHEESAFKDQTFHKPEKVSKKQGGKKNKQVQNSNIIDFRDSYEGDCDDDDYEKERQDNPNRWKMNTSKSVTKNHCQSIKNSNNENNINYKPTKTKNLPKKEKTLQKRRSSEKNLKVNTNLEKKPERSVAQVPPSLPPPPPPPKWGENRAKFSDVVARNPDSISPPYLSTGKFTLMKRNETIKPNASGHPKVDLNKGTNENRKPSNDYSESTSKFNIDNNLNGILDDRKFYYNNESILSSHNHQQHQNHHRSSNSYFINSLEQAYEPELIPYDDLPETDEPLMELESLEEDTRSPLWTDRSPMMNLLADTSSYSELETLNHVDKLTNNLTDSLKDNWLTVETNWEPLYSRGAVGEERSGVWGINTGGVWAAAPWGTPTPPTLQVPLLQQSEQDVQEHSGFDPFRSLSTIWTPSTSWDTKREK
ncbi:transmembrane protein 131 [Chelonus insularis]|uniref:transmembrane protein 131 n=1 Tax=Chelonus insularis TaxID=460826 RepID=UPI00158BBE2D|nr:transmembrane protein 131 [Chelonus insularis]